MPCLKLNYQKRRAGKESMKLVTRHSKVNNCLFIINPAVTYEMDYYMFDQETIYILLKAETWQNRNF